MRNGRADFLPCMVQHPHVSTDPCFLDIVLLLGIAVPPAFHLGQRLHPGCWKVLQSIAIAYIQTAVVVFVRVTHGILFKDRTRGCDVRSCRVRARNIKNASTTHCG